MKYLYAQKFDIVFMCHIHIENALYDIHFWQVPVSYFATTALPPTLQKIVNSNRIVLQEI